MQAIEKRYAGAYPEWGVFYLALHRDPKLRQQELTKLKQFLHQSYAAE